MGANGEALARQFEAKRALLGHVEEHCGSIRKTIHG